MATLVQRHFLEEKCSWIDSEMINMGSSDERTFTFLGHQCRTWTLPPGCLSMVAIDDLLSLEIVSSNTSTYSMSYSPIDQECTTILLLCKRAQSPCRNSSTWSMTAVRNINA